MGNLPKILVVEDDPDCQKVWPEILLGYVEMIFARTIAEAENLYTKHPDIVAITLDGSVPQNDNDVVKGNKLTTTPLISYFRNLGFRNRIIAASSSDESNDMLVKAGCDEAVPKISLTAYIRRQLSRIGKN